MAVELQRVLDKLGKIEGRVDQIPALQTTVEWLVNSQQRIETVLYQNGLVKEVAALGQFREDLERMRDGEFQSELLKKVSGQLAESIKIRQNTQAVERHTEQQAFYQRRGFWAGLIFGVIGALVAVGGFLFGIADARGWLP